MIRVALALFLISHPLAADEVVGRFVEHARGQPDGKAAYSFEREAYTKELNQLPIGVFDSGIGGLTVLEAILGLDAYDNETLKPGADGIPDFANEKFIYFGDQANMPYGNYPKAGHKDFLRELILKDVSFLLGKRYTVDGEVRFDKPGVKAIVIACNTATAFGLDDIRAAIGTLGLPVIVVGVVESGARGVREAGGNSEHALAVMATVGTCESGAYPRMIARALGLAGRAVPTIIQQGGADFAGIIEGESKQQRSVSEEALNEVRALLEKQRESGAGEAVGTVVLGCTHYPLVLAEIKGAFEQLRGDEAYANLIAPEINFVDPAQWTASELFRELALARLKVKKGQASVLPQHQFFFSVPNPACLAAKIAANGALEYDYKYGRQPGRYDLEDTIAVPLTPDRIPAASQKLVENSLPLVWNNISAAAGLSE